MKNKPSSETKSLEIGGYFEALYLVWGPQHWWPAQTAFEVIAGAILTQNTAWTNVEKALENLCAAKALSVAGIRNVDLEKLEQMLRPAGYFRQKARRLKDFVAWLDQRYGGSVRRMFRTPTAILRQQLLELNGIGPETADSILLFAGQHETFVVDAYTRRVFERHGLVKPETKYDQIRISVENALRNTLPASGQFLAESAKLGVAEPGPSPAEEMLTPVVHPPSAMSETARSELARRYNEFHALIVQTAKHYCLSRVAKCGECPLRVFLKKPVPLPTKARRGRSRR